ncbi:recombinase family protein [Thermoanaerobacter mathranii]|uniref:recombinase family protein n=1 Tax=Thermoanaerobacter mathranii TaxID=583357 RepID=UPI003D6C60A3
MLKKIIRRRKRMQAAVYARVSSEEQAERGTIENQVEFAVKYCDLHQIDIVEWYKDDGVTGIIPLEERPEGRRLLEDARNKKFDVVLVYRLDRLGRSARIILNAVYELEQNGIKIKSMTEPFDTSDPNGRFLLTVLAGVADLERETILERMQYGTNRAARAGKWLGGIVPYGYRVNEEGYLEINENLLPELNMSEADVVRLIYYLIAEQGYSTIKVADYLNALGVPTAYVKDGRQVTRGKRKVNTAGIWRPGRIRNMVVNTTYKGIHYYGKRTKKNRELIPREVPAIVSEEIWEKAQQKLKENQIEALKNAKRQYLLRGLIKCGLCGLTYQGQSYKGPKNGLKAYYVCGGKTAYRGPLQGKCPSKNVPAEWIENLVWEECVNFINNPGETIKELAKTIETKKAKRGELEHEKQTILKTLKEKQLERQNILDLYRRKIITTEDVERQFQKIDNEMKTLENRIKEIEDQIAAEETLLSSINTAEELLENLRAKLEDNPPFEVRREIVRTLVKEIIVDTKFDEKNRPYAVIKVKYNFSDVTRTVKDS